LGLKILLGDFNVSVSREDIFKPTIRNNGVRAVNFASSEKLAVKSTKVPHHEVHKYTRTSPEGDKVK
jgi:hypothetical protein